MTGRGEQVNQNATACGFLALPGELRNTIYCLVFGEGGVVMIQRGMDEKKKKKKKKKEKTKEEMKEETKEKKIRSSLLGMPIMESPSTFGRLQCPCLSESNLRPSTTKDATKHSLLLTSRQIRKEVLGFIFSNNAVRVHATITAPIRPNGTQRYPMPGDPSKTLIYINALAPGLLNLPTEIFRLPNSLKIISDCSVTTKFGCGVHNIRIGLSLQDNTYSIRTWTSCRYKSHGFERCHRAVDNYAFSIRHQLHTFLQDRIGENARLVVDNDRRPRKYHGMGPPQPEAGTARTGHRVAEETIVMECI